jgi:hypothetical protein
MDPKKIKDVRWATEKETINFYKFLKKKTNEKDLFTYNWLSKNGNYFINLHQNFVDDKTIDKISNYKLSYNQQLIQYKTNLIEYQKSINKKCICKGQLVKVVFDTYEFIGCDNYREPGWDHFRMYKPKEPIEPDYSNYKYEPSSNYLVELRKFYNLPKDLKPSIMQEYLIMKDVTLLAETLLKIGVNNKDTSNKRENIVKPILTKKLDKVKAQPLMIITLSDGNQIKKIPDFVCIKGEKVYIIEQKKDVHLINQAQTELYCEAVSFLINKSNKHLKVDYRYIIENGITDEENKIINFKDLEYYEFN